MRDNMEVLKYIPEGRENAISREMLSKVTGMPDRAVRREIRRLRDSGEPILTDTERGGYWLASGEDYGEMLRYYRTLTAYIRSLWKLSRRYRQWLLEHEKKGRPGNPEAAKNKEITYTIQAANEIVKEAGVCGKS